MFFLFRIRRLKCGEEKPRCQRCVKSGWQCDGYETPAESSSSKSALQPTAGLAPLRPRSRSPLSARPHGAPSGAPPRSPARSPSFPLDAQEQNYFQLFASENWTDLLGGKAFFWRDFALQESQTNSCVRHALVAIVALAMSTQKTASGIHLMDVSQGYHREFALQQYQKAIRSLRESIGDLDKAENSRKTLISCLVLAFFDNFIGNGGFAVQHVRYARNILLNSAPMQVPLEKPAANDFEGTLLHMFIRLDMEEALAMGVDDSRTFVVMSQDHTPILLPEVFNSLEEAQGYEAQILWEGYHYFYRTTYCEHIPREAVPRDVVEYRLNMINQLYSFHAALEPLILQTPPQQGVHPLSTIAAVKLCTVDFLIRLLLSLNTPEVESDALLPYFEYIFSTCRDILEYESEIDATTGSYPSIPHTKHSKLTPPPTDHEIYTHEVRALGPLSLLTLKCRNTSLRRSAISLLLSSHRREYMYDSLIAGQVAAWVMSLEEEGMDEIGFIPEEKRAWGVCVETDLQRRVARVRCKVGRKGTGLWREERTEVSW